MRLLTQPTGDGRRLGRPAPGAPLRVLVIVDHAVGVSGPHRNVVGSLNALTSRPDARVTLFTGRVDPDEPYARPGRAEIVLGYAPKDPLRLPTNAAAVWRLAARADVVYVPTNLRSLLYGQIAHLRAPLAAGPNVTYLPFINSHDCPGFFELRLFCRRWLEASEFRLRHVCRHTGSDSIRRVPHAIDVEKFHPRHARPGLWRELGLPGTGFRLLFVGRDNEPLKGVPQLLDALALLAADPAAPSVELVLAGRMSEETSRRAAALPNVALAGFRVGAELAALYASAQALVLPSSYENMPFVVLEALASGLPVLAGEAGGAPELFEDGVSGLLMPGYCRDGHFTPEAVPVLAAGLRALAADPDRAGRLGQAARERACRVYSEARLGEDLMNVFQEILAERRGLFARLRRA